VQGYTPRTNQSSHGGWDSVNGPVSPRRDTLRDWTRTSFLVLILSLKRAVTFDSTFQYDIYAHMQAYQ